MYIRLSSVIIIAFSIFVLAFTNNTNQWKDFKEIKGVKILTKTAKCATQYNTLKNEYYVFKYVNNNKYNIRLTYKINLWVGENCRSCDLSSPNEYEISLDIKAGQTLQYACSDDNKAFKLFKSSPKLKKVTKIKFDFINLRVEKI